MKRKEHNPVILRLLRRLTFLVCDAAGVLAHLSEPLKKGRFVPSARDVTDTDPYRQRLMSVRNNSDVESISRLLGAVKYGVLLWFNRELGFGFITPDDDGPDVFVHICQIAEEHRRFEVGQRVSYRADGTRCRPEAKTVYVL